MKKVFIFLIIVLGIGGYLYYKNPNILEKKELTSEEKIKKMVNDLTLEEKVSQLIIPSIRGDNVTNCKQSYKDILNKYSFGGIILFKENISNTNQTIKLINDLQNSSKIPLLIGVDQEGGSVTRLTTGTSFIGNMALTATNNADNAYTVGKIMGQELKSLGFNLDFAPSLDINNNPSNPVIGIRSFSDDPEIVSTFGKKMIEGLKEANIIPTVKHFPGHGDTETDSHIGLPLINKTYDELKKLELRPFKDNISDVDILMTAHIMFPEIEKETYVSIKDGKEITLPATLSKTIITDILKTDLNYQGLVITDALDMDAISKHFNKEDVFKLAINSGVDLLLMPIDINKDNIDTIDNYIKMATNLVKNKKVSEDRIDEIVTKILTLKDKYHLLEKEDNKEKPATRNLAGSESIIGSMENHNIEWQMAINSITCLKNNNILPIKVKDNDNILIFYAYQNELNSINYAINKLKEDKLVNDNVTFTPIYYKNQSVIDLQSKIKEASYIIVCIESSNSNDIKTGWQAFFIRELLDYAHSVNKKVNLISLNLPYDVARFTDADSITLAYLAKGMEKLPDFNTETVTYGANIPASIYMLFKDIPSGKLPVNIYKLDKSFNYTNEILFERGFSIK